MLQFVCVTYIWKTVNEGMITEITVGIPLASSLYMYVYLVWSVGGIFSSGIWSMEI